MKHSNPVPGISVVAILLALLGAVSCSSSADPKRKNLPLALIEYNQALRWGNLEVARSYLAPDYASKVGLKLRAVTGRVKISEVEMVDLQAEPDGERAVALVEFTWVETGSFTVKKGMELQSWKRIGNRWFLWQQTAPEDLKIPPSPFVD